MWGCFIRVVSYFLFHLSFHVLLLLLLDDCAFRLNKEHILIRLEIFQNYSSDYIMKTRVTMHDTDTRYFKN